MAVSVAIVGAGPGGFYTAEALSKLGAAVEIDLIDRLPTPFGLIRAGVAPDHQSTKNVVRAFHRTALRDEIRYYGNVEVGKDVSLGELRACYDAVVLAIGTPLDRALEIPGNDKKGVVGATAFVGWYNGHPDFRDLDPDLDTKAAAVIGVGNVAVDIARVLVKTEAEMAATDITDYAEAAIRASPLRDVYMFGRRGPVEAAFTNVELREMGRLEDAVPVVDPAALPDKVTGEWSDRDLRLREKNLETLREFTLASAAGKSKRVHFAFYARPVEVLGGERAEGLRLERTKVEEGRAVGTGEFFEVACGLVLPAIGYRSEPIPGLPFDEARGTAIHQDGRVDQGLYAVGWIKRGPTGVIGTNKPDGQTAAKQIAEDFAGTESDKPGRKGFAALLRERGVRATSYEDWLRIDADETAAAVAPKPRRKLTTIAEMLAVLDSEARKTA